MSAPRAHVAAIVVARDEHERIEAVVRALDGCGDVSEVIVVDDGSTVALDWIAQRYPAVRYIRHHQNRGKAAAMESGVQATRAEYIFFCDADLVGFGSEDASTIIDAVTSGAHRMYVGIRANPQQRAFLVFALCSGERCLHRMDWEALPAFYKKRFRVESGLNYRVKKRGGRLGYSVFRYRHTVRERKYGIWEGLRGRLLMAVDIMAAWLYIAFMDAWTRDGRGFPGTGARTSA